jgi:transitional endoplasmic reticulum ATPase
MEIPMPDEEARRAIFEVHTRDMPTINVDLDNLAKRTEKFSGADIAALCREAGMYALRENIDTETVEMRHFEQALEKVNRARSVEEENFPIVR